MDIKENFIVVVKDTFKEKFIEEFRKTNKLFAVTILGIDEFKKKYYFDYTSEAIYHINKKYKVIKSIAKIYLENLYFIDTELDNSKINFLKSIKKDLDETNLLIYDRQFHKYLRGKTVVLYNLKDIDRFYINMFESISKFASIENIDDNSPNKTKKIIYELPTPEIEVAFVASEISKLIKSGTSINKIKLVNVSKEYIFSIKRIFKDFKIPIDLNEDSTISSTIIFKQFKENFSNNIEVTLGKIKPLIKSDKDEFIYKKILDVLNDYYWASSYNDVKEFILDDLEKIKMPKKIHKSGIKTGDFLNDSFDEDDYIFLINFNQGIIPINKKDEDYLNDKLKLELGLSDSVDLNKKQIKSVQDKISTLKNLVVTYSKRNLSGELYISNAYDDNLFERKTWKIDLDNSDDYNKKVLLSLKDENRKYKTTSKLFLKLLNHYKDVPYCTYDNTFKGIDNDALKKYLSNGLTLSYSSMDKFYKCSFRYYLESIVKIDKFEDSFETVIGNIFHRILSKCFDDDFFFEEMWKRTIEEEKYEFKNMERFYLGLLQGELKFIINAISKQREYTNLDKALYEQKITVPIDVENKVVFKGFVDKIIYGGDGEDRVVAIIDYKTGNPELSIDNIPYGLDMQLPVYAYLLKNYEPLKNAKIGGFYLQKILNNKKDADEKMNALKLQGYSVSNPRILKEVDNTYENSSLIRSMKMGKTDFYAHAKVLREDQIDKIIAIVEEKIKTATKEILEGNFSINPKYISGKNKGCAFCNFKDICYIQNKDIFKLKPLTKDEFLGGEHCGMD